MRCRYATFVGVLEAASRDNLDFIKDKAIRALARLLSAKPEQEARLLAALVNKLGDPSRKLASKACDPTLPVEAVMRGAASVGGSQDGRLNGYSWGRACHKRADQNHRWQRQCQGMHSLRHNGYVSPISANGVTNGCEWG